jgi:glycosyltransferase involved in cell wall biosynthesis
MRIVLASQFPRNLESPHGGVEAVLSNLVPTMAKISPDLEINVVTYDNEISQNEIQEYTGFKVHRLPRTRKNELMQAWKASADGLLDYVMKMNPDVVHAHDSYGLSLAGKIDVPNIMTIHGFIHEDTKLSTKSYSSIRSIIWRYYETHAWSVHKHIISISPYVRERVSRVSNTTIYDIDNPISDIFFNIRRKVTKSIFSAAIICPRKNTLILVEAANLLAKRGVEFSMVLAGKIVDKGYGEKVKQKIQEYNLQEKVILIGSVPRERIIEELSKASVFALISYEENSPMCIEEAMAAGVPVVTSNRCGMPYMVRNHESGYLVDPDNADEVAKRLSLLLNDVERNKSMGEEANRVAKRRFHSEIVAKQTLQVYRDLCE